MICDPHKSSKCGQFVNNLIYHPNLEDILFVVTYIELKSGYNHPNLVDLYDPILDESECVSESSDALYNPFLDDSECACKSSKGGSYFIIHFWMILSKMWI